MLEAAGVALPMNCRGARRLWRATGTVQRAVTWYGRAECFHKAASDGTGRGQRGHEPAVALLVPAHCYVGR